MTYFKPNDGPKANAPPRHAYDYVRGMPLLGGHYVALEYVPKAKLPNMLNLWREWCKEHPRSEWPFHVTDFAERLKRDGRKSELLALTEAS